MSPLKAIVGLCGYAFFIAGFFWLRSNINQPFGLGIGIGALACLLFISLTFWLTPTSFYKFEDQLALAIMRNDYAEIVRLRQRQNLWKNRKRRKFSEEYSKPVRIILYTIAAIFLFGFAGSIYASLVLNVHSQAPAQAADMRTKSAE